MHWHILCDLKVVQMIVKCSVIQEPMLYKLEYNATEATENICYVKAKITVYHCAVIRIQKFSLGSMTTWQDQVGLKPGIFKAVLQTKEENLVSCTWRVSGELGISKYSLVHHLHDLIKSIHSCWIVPIINKILQNFWLTLVKNFLKNPIHPYSFLVLVQKPQFAISFLFFIEPSFVGEWHLSGIINNRQK